VIKRGPVLVQAFADPESDPDGQIVDLDDSTKSCAALRFELQRKGVVLGVGLERADLLHERVEVVLRPVELKVHSL
jgi:hypothetical protein